MIIRTKYLKCLNIFIKRFVGLLLIILSTLVSDAQEKTGTPSFEQQFELFKQQSVQKHQSFISRNDSIFIAFLKKSWKTVKLVDGISNSIIKPKNQPEFKKEFIEEKVQILLDTTPTVPIVYFTADSIQKQSELKSEMPITYNARVVKQSFDFFGSQEIINVWPDIKPRFTLVSENAIVDFYTSLSKNNQYWGQYLSQLAKLQEKYMLNDWGFYQLAKHAAYSLYDEPNEQRLFCWYLLLKSGYRAKLGYNDAEVYILLPASNKLFSVPYFIESGEVYYLVDASKKKLNNIQTYEMDYPGNQKLFSFELFHYPFFEGELVSRTINYKGKQYTFEFDKGKLDFLSTYPQCELKLYFKGIN